jgi:hypothetical protein
VVALEARVVVVRQRERGLGVDVEGIVRARVAHVVRRGGDAGGEKRLGLEEGGVGVLVRPRPAEQVHHVHDVGGVRGIVVRDIVVAGTGRGGADKCEVGGGEQRRRQQRR